MSQTDKFTPVNNFIACFDTGLFDPGGIDDAVENQTADENLAAFRKTVELAEMDEEGAHICLATSSIIFEDAIAKFDTPYLKAALEITQSRINNINEILNSDIKIILLQEKNIDEEDLIEESEALTELLVSCHTQYKHRL